jgi:hypothetical protein
MNIIELLREDPLVFGVIDFEAAVGRDAGGVCEVRKVLKTDWKWIRREE